MNEQDDTKLWQILGHASQPAPGDDFARKVMMRIEREECAPASPDGTFCPGNGSPFHRHLEY